MNRRSFMFQFLQTIDTFIYNFDGYIVDFRKLNEACFSRRLFSKDALIKADLSLIPFRDRQLRKIAKKYGGWNLIISPQFQPPKTLYEDLLSIGINKEEFDLTRKYNADPKKYREDALDLS